MILDDSDYGNNPKSHPTHQWFLRSGFYLSLMGGFLYFFRSSTALDLHLHDTYLVISIFHVVLSMGSIFVFLGLLYVLFYFVFKIQLNSRLSKAHYGLTAFPLVLVLFALIISKKLIISTSHQFSSFFYFEPIILMLILIFLLGQFIFILNVILSLWKDVREKEE